MVPRLRVAVRVVSEDEYLTHLAKGPPGPSLYRGEKKFAVVIPNPQQWQIGHLAAEVKRQFKKLYRRDIGTIKYLSHGFDDCQLHKDLSVYEHLYDEGRARTDLGDQYAVVKAVFSQCQPLREGSIMPDFDDPQYEHRPMPPVPIPSWSTAPSKPGKRPVEEDDEEQYFGASEYPDVKRQRLSDSDDADSDDDVADSDNDVAQSVERDEAMQGVEIMLPASQIIIQDSQSSPRRELFHSTRQPSVAKCNTSSFRPSRTSFSASETMFSQSERLKFDQMSESSANPTIPKSLRFDPNHGKTQALLTPPSDASKKSFANGEPRRLLPHSSKKKATPTQAPGSGLKRPGIAWKDIYDVEESDDIECSLMSHKFKRKSAADKRFPASSFGPKSSPTASDSRKERETPDSVIFTGNVKHSEVINLMENASYIRPTSMERPRTAISYRSPEYNSTADEDGYNQRSDVAHLQSASTSAWHLPGEHVSCPESKKPVAGPFITLFWSKSKKSSAGITDDHSDDIADEVNLAVSPVRKQISVEVLSGSEHNVNVALQYSQSSKGKDQASSLRDKPAATSKQFEEKPESQTGRRRRRKSRVEVGGTTGTLNVDTASVRLETRQTTPMDSPGEQLLEMQASSQKSRQDSQGKDTKKTKKRTKAEHETQATAANTPDLSTADRQVSEKQLQKPRLVCRAQIVEKPLAGETKPAEDQANSDSASRSPYARPPPPKGSMGLGVTNSPRRPSTLSAAGSSSRQRVLFQTELTSAQAVTPISAMDNKDGSDSDDESDDESEDPAVGTPSKQAAPGKSPSGFQRYKAKPKSTIQPQKTTAVSRVKTESAIRPESPADIIPNGMAAEHDESTRDEIRSAAPKKSLPKGLKSTKMLEAQTEQALPAKVFNKGSMSSVALTERSESPAVAFVALPQGMTMEQYEEIKKRKENAPPKERKQTNRKVAKQLQAEAERALLARSFSGGGISSVAVSEEPESKPKAKKAPKSTKTAAVVPTTSSASTTTTKSLTTREPGSTGLKKVVRSTTKAKSTPSTTASDSSRASHSEPTKAIKLKSIASTTALSSTSSQVAQPARTKATTATKASSTTASSSSKPSQPARTTPTPATTPAAPASKTKARAPPVSEPEAGSLLKKLKHRVAGQSARNSPAAPTFAMAPKPVAKARAFDVLDDDSDNESESDKDEEVEERGAKVVMAARPDQSTRSVVVDDDGDDYDDDDDDDDDGD